MDFIICAIIGAGVGAGIVLYYASKSDVNLRKLVNDEHDLKRTLLIGLYHRFKKDNMDKERKHRLISNVLSQILQRDIFAEWPKLHRRLVTEELI